jgi:hypothetical protein
LSSFQKKKKASTFAGLFEKAKEFIESESESPEKKSFFRTATSVMKKAARSFMIILTHNILSPRLHIFTKNVFFVSSPKRNQERG